MIGREKKPRVKLTPWSFFNFFLPDSGLHYSRISLTGAYVITSRLMFVYAYIVLLFRVSTEKLL